MNAKIEGGGKSKRGCGFWIIRGLLAIVVLIVGVLALGYGYEALAESNDSRAYPPPGQLFDVGGYRLHISCMGEGSPTVILDALQPGTVSNWVWIQPEIARSTRVCAYDRAGLGWSDVGPEPRDAQQNTRELETLLQNAGIEGPYVLVGHSLGGLYARVFAGQHPDEVQGMVLIDSSHPDGWQREGIPEGVGMNKDQLAMGPIAARFGMLRVMSFFPIDADLPAQQQAELKAFYATPKFAEISRQVDLAFPSILAQGREVTTLGDIPLVVVTRGDVDAAAVESHALARELQIELSQLSSNSDYRVVYGATHTSLVNNPDHAQPVITAIHDVLESIRSGTSLTID